MTRLLAHPAWFLWAALATAAGCQFADTAASDRLAAARGEWILAEEPDGAMGVLDARDAMPDDRELVIVGRIGGRRNPWTENEAAFVMADASLALEGEGKHHCDDPSCAFCKDSAGKAHQRMLALVQFVDTDGGTIPIDARELFQVATNDTVVVRGRARKSDDGWLVVAANGLYVRR